MIYGIDQDSKQVAGDMYKTVTLFEALQIRR